MRRIHIDRLVERKQHITRHDRSIDRGVEVSYARFRKTRDEFLHVANALCARGGVTGSEAVPEGQI